MLSGAALRQRSRRGNVRFAPLRRPLLGDASLRVGSAPAVQAFTPGKVGRRYTAQRRALLSMENRYLVCDSA
jgi:hypothetical protein